MNVESGRGTLGEPLDDGIRRGEIGRVRNICISSRLKGYVLMTMFAFFDSVSMTSSFSRSPITGRSSG